MHKSKRSQNSSTSSDSRTIIHSRRNKNTEKSGEVTINHQAIHNAVLSRQALIHRSQVAFLKNQLFTPQAQDTQPVGDYSVPESMLNNRDSLKKHDKPLFAVRKRDVHLSTALAMKQNQEKHQMDITRPTTATATINPARASTSHLQIHERKSLRN